MRHFSKLFCLLLALTLAGSAHAQLSAGDIAFVSYDADGTDAFSFLALAPISNGAEIRFTDNGWQSSTNSFRANEGIWIVTFSTDIACGTEVVVTAAGATDVMGNSVGSVTPGPGNALSLAAGGDQVLAYQGDEANPSFIAAINNEGAAVWQDDATNSNTSALPPGLVQGMTAVALDEIDNATYGCTFEAGTRADLLQAINKAAMWLGSNTSGQVPASCAFSITDCTSGPGGGGGTGGDGCMDLFISEYIEGGGNNKCLELYNPTGGAIDLSGYVLNRFSNGSTNPVAITLSGSIPALGTYVICNSSAAAAFLAVADATSGSVSHNGDDAYTLENNGTVIDRFGQVGFDPGSQWLSGGVGTANQTLVRKEAVNMGDPNSGDPFDPSAEWDNYPQDDASFLGAHTSVCSQGGPGGGGDGCMELFISEYIEGSSNNKCLELYNPTGGAIDLSGYVLNRFSNGGTNPAAITLSGSIPAQGTYVICNSNSAAAFLLAADATSGSISHNGDDAYTLEKNGAVIDRFGQVGFDPGSQWSSGGVSTANRTLVRKESVNMGDPNSGDPFDPSLEWDEYPQDDASFLGFHISDCVVDAACLITSVTVTALTTCKDDGTDSQDDDYYYAEVRVAVNNPPSTGDLELFGPDGFIAEISASSITNGEAVFSFVELPANGMEAVVTASFEDEDCSADGISPAVFPCSLPDCTPVINELDYNNPGTDDREFVELYNPCSEPINLGDYRVVFVNGANGQIYGDFQLPSVMLGPGKFFVICGNGANTANCDLDVSPNTNLIQNGDPDAVALFYLEAIADAVSYEGSTTGFTEGSGDGLFDLAQPALGIGRFTDGADSDRNNVDFSIQCITPGAPNTSESQFCTIPDDITITNVNCGGGPSDASYDAATDQYTISSSCGHTYGAQDQYILVGKQACGVNASVEAKIVSVFPTTGFAGITLQESAAPGARRMSIVRYANNQKFVEYRPVENGPYYQYWLPSFTAFTDYVRVRRTSYYFFAEVSFDGQYWMTIYQQYMANMPTCLEAGMIVSSYFNGLTTQATFEGFKVTDSALPRPPAGPVTGGNDDPVAFNVFPNPAVNELSVTLDNPLTDRATITIMGLDGRELYRSVHNVDGTTVNIQLSGMKMSAGLYILTVNTGEEVLTKRFVKANP